MSYWTGPCCLYSHFLQKNGGEGCHRGQDLVYLTLISYRRMEEKDVIVDRTLSISGTDLFYFLFMVRKATRYLGTKPQRSHTGSI